MSRPSGTTILGAFVVGGALLLILTLVGLGTASFLHPRAEFASYFDESVHGLEVGAPVKFRGVTVGQVTHISIGRDVAGNYLIPVTYSIDQDQVDRALGAPLPIDDRAFIASEIARGLRARLQVQSFLTGLLYLELDFHTPTQAPALFRGPRDGDSPPEIPVRPSAFAEIGQNLSDFATKLSTVDFAGLVGNLQTLATNLNAMVGELDLPSTLAGIRGAADATAGFFQRPDLAEAVDRIGRAAARVESLAVELESGLGPVASDLPATLAQLRATLAQLQESAAQLSQAVSGRSGITTDLAVTLRRLRETADAVRELADSIERTPNAVVAGRSDEAPNP